jgi:NADP-dependent aldehyde dehydrogenase
MITENIIGVERSAASGKWLYADNRMTGDVFPERFSAASQDDVDLALRKAVSAWRTFRAMPGSRRAAFLRAIADRIENAGDTLVSRVMAETAYPQARVIVERTRTVNQLRMFAAIIAEEDWRERHVDEALPDRAPSPRPELRRALMAIGPVVVFGASNFPLAYSTAGGDTASALAVGCPVIVKAHDVHLGTNALVAEAIVDAARETGMPDGVFSSLNGDGLETGKALVLHPDTAAVGFTGSLSGGRALFDLGAGRPKPIPVFAEMGSVNPIFILPGRVEQADETLPSQLATSMTMSVGQFCTNPGILVVARSAAADALIGRLATAVEAVDPAPMLNAGIARSFHRGVAHVSSVEGVLRVTKPRDTGDHASPVLARVPADIFLARPDLHHEIFGPYTLVVECDHTGQMLDVAASIAGQLTVTLQADVSDVELALRLRDILVERAGRLIFNGVPTGVEVCDAMTHGGPYPATTDERFTAVGRHAIRRWVRPVTFQNWPEAWLPGIF